MTNERHLCVTRYTDGRGRDEIVIDEKIRIRLEHYKARQVRVHIYIGADEFVSIRRGELEPKDIKGAADESL